LGWMLALCDPTKKLNAPATPARATRASWHNRSGERVVVELDRPRDIILVRSLRSSALVTMHASMGTRPDWIDEPLKCYPTPATHGGGARIIGECIGRHRYIEGSYCPLRWEPSPLSIAEARADYIAWWRGLDELVWRLANKLTRFLATPPRAPRLPWHTRNDARPQDAAVSRATSERLSD